MLRAIWPSIEHMKNTLPESSHTTSVDLLCFFLFWIISFPFLYISPSKLRWLLLVKCIIMPIAGIALFIWAVVMAKGFGPLLTRPTKIVEGYSATAVFFTGITSAIGPSATFALNMPDYCRYSKRPKDAFWGSALGLPITLTLIAFLGACVTSACEEIYGVVQWNPVLVVGLFESRAARFFVALIFWFATLGTNICANSIAFGNDSAFLFPRWINIRRGSFICGLLGLAITPWNIENSAGSFMAFLNGYSVFLGPIAGLVCTLRITPSIFAYRKIRWLSTSL
jgi:NCS1 family nucleobase:cation symporter-1